MSGFESETKIKRRTLFLHRMDVYASRPDKSGSWNLGLKILAPQFKKQPDNKIDGPVKKVEPHKSYRGGWQLTVMREFIL